MELQNLLKKFREAKKLSEKEFIAFCSDQQIVLDANRIIELRRQKDIVKEVKNKFNVKPD